MDGQTSRYLLLHLAQLTFSNSICKYRGICPTESLDWERWCGCVCCPVTSRQRRWRVTSSKSLAVNCSSNGCRTLCRTLAHTWLITTSGLCQVFLLWDIAPCGPWELQNWPDPIPGSMAWKAPKPRLITTQCVAEWAVAMASRLSIHDVKVSWSHRLEYFKNNFTVS